MFLLQNLGANLLLVLITIIQLIGIGSVIAQPTYTYYYCLGNDTANTDYKTNLTILLGSLPSKAALNSFYNGTFNGIFSFYLCRGDVTSDLCQNCVKNASQEIQNLCPSNNQAIIWYAQCMLSYNNSNFFGLEQTYPRIALFNRNSTSPDDTTVALAFMYTLVSKAPFTDMMFSVGESGGGGGGSQPRYGLAQCRRDISSGACSDCLGQLMGVIDQCCQGKRGWRVLAPSCYLRYEEYLFFAPQLLPPPTASNPLPAPSNRNGGKKTVVIALGVVSAATTVVLTLLGFYCYRRRSRKGRYNHKTNISKRRTRTHPLEENIDAEEQQDGREMHYFNLKTINVATNGFSDGNKLGQGGFGPVYKGKLNDGREIAVKRLLRNAGQGLEEFKTEVKLIVKLQHRNLVRLVGCCIEGDEKLLVYEYMANTSLDSCLFNATKCKDLDWAKRANIVRGIARGLLYLHEDSRLNIIHRDLKASNILLDDEMNAKISDFGTARTFYGNQIESSTSRVVGTYGYMSPEYAMGGSFSIKSDVYSFGVLLLEIISGRKISDSNLPAHAQSLLPYAWRLWDGGKAQELIDRNLISNCPVNEVSRWIHIGLLCVQEHPGVRPSMSKVVLMLGGQSADLPKPSEPPLSYGRYTLSDQSLSDEVLTGSDETTSFCLYTSKNIK